MFSVGEKVSHPMHGAGIIENIVERQDGASLRRFYTLKLCVGSLVLFLPCDSCSTIGVRPIISRAEADQIMSSLSETKEENVVNWNQRYRENMDKIKSGDIHQLLVVIKTLIVRENKKGLSNGERKMLTSAKKIIISELMLALDRPYDELESIITHALA